MSRYDKYDPFDGGYRATLNAAIVAADAGKLRAVSINAAGRAIIGGAALTDLRGIICPTEAMPAVASIDVMTDGEVGDPTTTAGVAFGNNDVLYAHIDGSIDAVSTAGLAVGFIVNGPGTKRAVIRFRSVL
jgi:hypothetical protein